MERVSWDKTYGSDGRGVIGVGGEAWSDRLGVIGWE